MSGKKSRREHGVICLHGFERTSITEKKFKTISDRLACNNISSFRFDYAGCGISDGDFRYTTINSMKNDFERAVECSKKFQRSSIFRLLRIVYRHALLQVVISAF